MSLLKSLPYQRKRKRQNRFFDDVVARKAKGKSATHGTTNTSQISAPANTTQFLIDDFESRYKLVDFSDKDLAEKENLGCKNLSPQPVKDLEQNGFEQSVVNEKMPYSFDEYFGQMEFEDLYAHMQC